MLVPGGQPHKVILHSSAVATADGTVLDCINISNGALSIAGFSIEGISGDTITFEVSGNDETDWYGILTENVTTGTEATTATTDGMYRTTIAGMQKVRARLTRSAGTVTVIAWVMP